MLRQYIPETIKRPLRVVRYYVGSATGLMDPLIPPPWLHAVGDLPFRMVGDAFMRYFIELCDLKPTDRVLDVGSGTGRIAISLADYLTSGTYDGIDIVKPSIDWCNQAYRDFPNFRFHHSDIYNKFYNPAGSVKASEYQFPFADDSFDFLFLASVFTHMLTDDVDHYLTEMRRVLAPTGKALFTTFLLNEDTRDLINQGKAMFSFRHPLNGCFVEVADVPERAVAFNEADLKKMVANHGFEVVQTYYGDWRGVEGFGGQDMLIVR